MEFSGFRTTIQIGVSFCLYLIYIYDNFVTGFSIDLRLIVVDLKQETVASSELISQFFTPKLNDRTLACLQ